MESRADFARKYYEDQGAQETEQQNGNSVQKFSVIHTMHILIIITFNYYISYLTQCTSWLM
jgi:hypothetical protein